MQDVGAGAGPAGPFDDLGDGLVLGPARAGREERRVAVAARAKLVSQNEMSQTFEQELSDYRDVQGIKIPFSIRMLSNGIPQGQIVVEKVEFNVKIDDAIFRMPR